ncbi:MAG: bifunctional enoyl-CoA hydratase/phosphate acetyltransferase [Pseudomonadota bacterium]
MSVVANTPYDQLKVGDSAELVRVCTQDDFIVFATASGNYNPMHLVATDEAGDEPREPIAPAMWIGSLISAVLGNMLPGAGTIYKSQHLKFEGHAKAGDELLISAKVLAKGAAREVVLETAVHRRADNARLVVGEAVVVAPDRAVETHEQDVPGLVVQSHRHFDALIKLAEPLDPIPTAVIAPEDANSLGGALLAHRHTIITPILIGDPEKIAAAAKEIDASLDGIEIVEADTSKDAAHFGVDLVDQGKARAVMKGHLHTNELLKACLRKENGLRTGRRLTHSFVMDVPGVSHPIIVSDAAINIAPDLLTKVDIVQNAIDVAHAIGIDQPKVGVLSAVETVNAQIPSSIDGALLSKMAERGQITGGIVDGPLAMDNAVDLAAARIKGITSPVAGRAEVLVVPNLDAGNMLAKQLIFVGRADGAGIVLGASVPIILNSRADSDKSRLASCAVAALHHARQTGRTRAAAAP